MAFTKYNTPLGSEFPRKELTRKPPEKIIHISPEVTRLYCEFPDIWWDDPKAPRLSRKPSDKIPSNERKGICITKALTIDRSIYSSITQLKTGPSTSTLETSLNRWTLEGALKSGETPEIWALKLVDKGWHHVRLRTVDKRLRNALTAKQKLKAPEKDFGTQLVDQRAAERAAEQVLKSQELRHKSPVIKKFMDAMDLEVQEINKRFADNSKMIELKKKEKL
jgi:hypothetical protein